MQILYGNDGVNYKVLAKTSDISSGIVRELGNSHFLSYDFTKNNYPDGKEPEALSFVTTTLNGTLGSRHILVSKSKRMYTYETPCYMSHVQIMGIKDGMRSYTNESIRSLYDMKFISSDEAEMYKDGVLKLENFDGINIRGSISNEYNSGITDKARKAIISLLACCDSNFGKVTIAVDAERESYNERVKKIVLDIYTHMPYGWRSRFGFCSFITTNSQSPDGVKLQFVESGTPSSGFQNFLDLNIHEDEYFEEQMKNTHTEYREYVCEFLNKTETERKIFFEELAGIFNIEDGVREYCEWKKNLDIWDCSIKKIRKNEEEDNKEQVLMLGDLWSNFIKEHSSGNSDLLMENFRNIVKKYIDENKEILLYLKNENRKNLKIYCENALDEDRGRGNIRQCKTVLEKYSKFFEFIGCHYPDEDIRGFIDEVLQNKYEIENLDKRLQRLESLNKWIEELCKLPSAFYKSFYQKWLNIYIEKCSQEKNIEEGKADKKKREKEKISLMFSQNRDYEEDYNHYFNRFSTYDLDIKEFFKKKAGEWLLRTEIDVFKTSYESEKKWCYEHSDYIDNKDIKKYLECFKEKEYETREKHWGEILINNTLDKALEMLDEEVAKEEPGKRERAAGFLSGWLDENLQKRIRMERENPENIKKILEKMNWLFQYSAGKADEWIHIIDYKKYRDYQQWTNIKTVALFMEYAQVLFCNKPGGMQEVYVTGYSGKKETYTISNGNEEMDISMDLEEAIMLAVFILEPEKGLWQSLEEDIFIKVLDSSLLGAYHWMQLFTGDYNSNIKDIIWEKYFMNDILLADGCVKKIGDRTISRKKEKAIKDKEIKCLTTEKELQYERIISDKELGDLKKCQQNWEKVILIMPSALAALMQMFLIKAFSCKIGNIGLYTAILMAVTGIGFIARTVFLENKSFINTNQKICRITGGVMFLGLGWIVMFLNMLV